jgi:4-hydroxy-3-polyprenylbenzoate decarboxylase
LPRTGDRECGTRNPPLPLVVALTGASGAIYGIRLLQRLRALRAGPTHLVLSRNAERVLALETDWTVARLGKLADRVWEPEELAAPLASGSFRTRGMAIAPCSIKTLAAVAGCHAADLIARAADVTLKERRPLVLLVRETPLHPGHLRCMLEAAQSGATILPPVPAFYARPRSVADLVDQTVGKVLDLLGVDDPGYRRWDGGNRR